MTDMNWDPLLKAAARIPIVKQVGRVSSVESGLLEVTGLGMEAGHGDQVLVSRRTGSPILGEVLRLGGNKLSVLPDATPEGVSLGDRVTLEKGAAIAPDDGWIGRIIDPTGKPLDGRRLVQGAEERSLRATPLPPAERALLGDRLETGMTVFNTLLPIVQGQRIGLFAGSGVGKSSLLAHFACHMQADVVVLALIGERGRELGEFVQTVLGPQGLSRTVIVASTSDQSPLMRRRCAWTAMAVAEYFRDKGRHVLFLADSLTRFAEAHREVAVATGELPTMRGYPPSLAHQLMSLCERAGPGREGGGTITAVLSVLVAASDMEEPVADILRGVLDGHVVLDRGIAERGRFPAIDLLRSVSRSLPAAASEDENELIAQTRSLIGLYEQSRLMIDAGLYEEGRNKELDRAVAVWADLDSFISSHEPRSTPNSFEKLRLILRKAQSIQALGL